jgi:hypothetical protein
MRWPRRWQNRGGNLGCTLRINGLSAASTLEEMSAVLQRMAVYQAVPQMAGADDAADPEAAETARLAALMPPTKPSCSTACACTAAASWAWRPTNTPR